jgi:hypothetical protein
MEIANFLQYEVYGISSKTIHQQTADFILHPVQQVGHLFYFIYST